MTNAFYINKNRLNNNLINLSNIGKSPYYSGINRSLGNESYTEATNWLLNYWKNEIHLSIKIDPIANIRGIYEGSDSSLPPILIGSHHDAVPNGGMFDGALGVLISTEVIQTLKENNILLNHPLHLISFTAEEPNPFNVSTLGSKVASGILKKNDLLKINHIESGEPLKNAINALGGNLEEVDNAIFTSSDICAFIECHIEQGRRLFDKALSLATVTSITGIYRENILIIGEANHAGTTTMKFRKDALLAASELNIVFEDIIKKVNSDEVVGTVGYLNVSPNSANIIPGKISLSLELRTCSSEVKDNILTILSEEIDKIIEKRKVKIERKISLDQSPIVMDKNLLNILNEGVKSINEPITELVSMAGHDAANIQRIAPSGMIFVQSVDGKSHCHDEYSRIEDIKKAANALLQSILILDKSFN
jgi:N-carbamoyl-L-amino-acid hydrolase